MPLLVVFLSAALFIAISDTSIQYQTWICVLDEIVGDTRSTEVEAEVDRVRVNGTEELQALKCS